MRRKHWPRKAGLGLNLGLGGGGVAYLLNDSFLDTLAAGSVDGTAATPGPGTRTLQDSGPIVSVGSGIMTSSGAATALTDPNRYWGSHARVAGKMLISKIRTDNNGMSTGPMLGWFTVSDPVSYVQNEGVTEFYLGNRFYYANSDRVVNTATLDTWYKHALILRSTGMFWLHRIDANNKWYLLWIENSGSTATLYPSLCAVNSGRHEAKLDFIRIPTLLWTPKPLVADAFGGTWPTTDGGGLTGLETGGAGESWLNGNSPEATTWSIASGEAVNAPVVGSNLVTNGEFTSDVTSWTAGVGAGDPVFSQVDSTVDPGTNSGGADVGVIKITAGATSPTVVQIITSSPDYTWYRAYARVYAPSANTRENAGRFGIVNSLDNMIFQNTSEDAWNVFQGCTRSGTADLRLDIKAAIVGGAFTTGDIVYFDQCELKPLTLSQLMTVCDTDTADPYIEATVTAAVGFQVGVALCVDDETNPQNFILAYLNRNDNKVYVDKCVAGIYTNIFSMSVTPVDDKMLTVRKIGTSIYAWYNKVNVGSGTCSDAGIVSNTKHGMFQTGNGATETNISDIKIYAVGSDGEYALLDMFCN